MSVNADAPESVVGLATEAPVWERFFTVAPLVLVGSKERDGYDLAPKHMAMPLGWGDYFCFVCSPRHATYRNVLEHRSFTVSFPRPEQIVEAGMAAGPRAGAEKPTLAALSTFPATRVDGVLLDPRWHPQLDDLLATHLRLGERTQAHGTVRATGLAGCGKPVARTRPIRGHVQYGRRWRRTASRRG